ncbi:MAG TPA: glutamine synthetase family protein [Gaiellaceae bacterium]
MSAMSSGVVGDELVAFLYADLAGLNRGRTVPLHDLERRLATGVGWVPADQAITVFGPLGEPNPWGALGDLRLVPDPATATRVDLWPGLPPLHFYLCDARTLDGAPWNACPRALLQEALARFTAETGLTVWAAFEHEFVLEGHVASPPPAFTMEALRLAEPLGAHIAAALRLSGHELETFLPEYGANQFELTCAPRDALAAADEASIAREIVREVARRLGWRATFAPIPDPDGSGNGVHIHLSFRDASGAPVTFDAGRPGRLALAAGRFAAGVLRHVPAICAAAAPTAVSYLRLVPHRWSAGWSCLGERNRETVLRIPETIWFGGADPAAQLNLEFRAADGACSPHFALALVVLAGLEGMREQLEPPPLIAGDPEALSAEEREALGVCRLPGSLGEAVDAFELDALVQTEVSDDMRAGYTAMKRLEIALLDGVPAAEACARYARVY